MQRSSWSRTLFMASALLCAAGSTQAEEPHDVEGPKARSEDADVDKARALLVRGDAHREARRFKEAIEDYRAAITALRTRGGDHLYLAMSLNNLAFTLQALGQASRALPRFKEALEVTKRLYKGDHAHVEQCLNSVANVLEALGKPSQALPLYEEALEMARRLYHDDHPALVRGLNNLAGVFGALGKADKALPLYVEAAAMSRRVYRGDHPHVASVLNNMAVALVSSGKAGKALPPAEEALAMYRRLHHGDHPDVASALNSLAGVLETLGKAGRAFPLYKEALAMRRRLYQGDHPDVASSLISLAGVHGTLGKARRALSRYEEALAMCRRLHQEDHPSVAVGLTHLAVTLETLGRASHAQPLFEEALAMYRRLYEGDHPQVALSLNNLAFSHHALGRASQALPLYDEALEMTRCLYEGDHPSVAMILNNLAAAFEALGRAGQALPLGEEALEMRKRLYPGDHPDVAQGLANLAALLEVLGKAEEALSLGKKAVAMYGRLYEGDHPRVALGLNNLAWSLVALGRRDEAKERATEAIRIGQRIGWAGSYKPRVLLGRICLQERNTTQALEALEQAAAQLEARRMEAVSLGSEGRARYVASLRRWDPFPLMIRAHVMQGRADAALDVLERSRGREMLDLVRRGQDDPMQVARSKAVKQGDASLVARIDKARHEVDEAASAVTIASSQVEHARRAGDRKKVRMLKRARRDARAAYERALRARLSLVREALPEGRPLQASQVRALLGEGERLLAYSLSEYSCLLVASAEGVTVHPLGTEEVPIASGTISREVQAYRDALAQRGATPSSTANHPGTSLFKTLLPNEVWTDVKSASRVYILPHGALHQLPFEALVIASDDGKPVYWAQEGPPIAYAASAAVLAALKARRSTSSGTVVAVGDPVFEGAVRWPAKGAVVKDISPGSQAAVAKLRPGDVITGYGGKDAATYEDLIASIRGTDPEAERVTLTYEREGKARTATLKPGRIGVFLAKEPPPVAGPKVLARTTLGVLRGRTLQPLPGTGDEVRGIEQLLKSSGKNVTIRTLLGPQATEAALFEATNSPTILHLATHGLIEPDRGARASRLALTPPRVPAPGNDGFLSLGDLLERWRSRLEGTQLVALSACDSHAGRLDQNEGMLALPWGFCFAGARSCIASLWQVDDQSTAKLMTALYRRMFAGDTLSPCEALHAARKQLMKTYPDPYHWAPFVFAGAP